MRFILLFLISLSASPAISQDVSKDRRFSFVPDSLFPVSSLSEEEKEKHGDKMKKSKDLRFYSEEGDRLPKQEAFGMMQEHDQIAFIDSNYVLQVLVLVPSKGAEEGEVDGLSETERGAPSSFELPLLKKEEDFHFNRDEEREEILVLNFWFLACKPCKMEIPELNGLVEKFEEAPVRFLAISFDEASEIRSFLDENAFHYEQGVDAERAVNGKFGVNSYPAHVIIDREGEMRYFETGYSAERVEQLEKAIEGLLE